MATERTCPQCGTMLSSDALEGLCPTCVGRAAFASVGAAEISPEIEAEFARLKPEEVGEQIGPYKLMEQIGQGGFGTVWVADQERPVRRRVALKIIKLGMDTKEVIARFEQERQALALMDHPHIAKVLDAGATQWGRPFFVMELVRGIKITDYCDQANLPTAERLALFIQVCHAVQHAHQKGIIHRDLKPSNILVTLHDGVPVPKVIDFGVAKATQQMRLTDLTIYTQFQQMIGTPLYMSPEQAEMSGLDIDTRSDIYSLGVLLYELLTGRTPFDPEDLMKQGLDEIRRTIREQEPQKPSTFLSTMAFELRTDVAQHRQVEGAKLVGLIRGDLDWIVMKALEKDRARRYETANGLAKDIERLLASEPVLARPPSQLYRFQRTVQRNKFAFAASALIAGALLVAVVVLATSRTRITRERNEKATALQQRDTALTDAQNQLFNALLSQARAGRFSRQPGQRLDSLKALAEAAAIHPDERLRDEAIAAMALPDVRPGPSWKDDRPEYVDGACRLSVTFKGEAILLHSIPDGREVRRIESARRRRDLTLSRDGRFLAEQDAAFRLRIWRLSDGQTVFGDEPGRSDCWAFSADSRQLAVGNGDEIVRYDLEMGREMNRWRARGSVHALAFHPDDRQLAVGYQGLKFVSTFAVDSTPSAELPVGTMNGQVLAWHPDGRRLAVGGSDPRIQIWDVPGKRKVATLQGHVQQVTMLGFHPGGGLLVSGAWDAIYRMWEPSSGRQVLQFSHPLSSVGFSTDGRWIGAFATGDGGQLLEVAACPEYRTIVSSLGAGQGEYFDGGISPDGRLLAMGMSDGVRIWEIASGREAAFLPIRRTPSVFFQPDGRELITCGDTGLHRWAIPARTGSAQPFQLGPPQRMMLPFLIPMRACRSRDGRLIAVTSEEAGGAVVLEAATGAMQTPLLGHKRAGNVALSPDGKWLATAGWQSPLLRLWNIQTGKLAHEWGEPAPLSIGFTPDSRELVSMQLEACDFWSSETFQRVRRLPRNASPYVTPAAFSPDEKLVAVETTPGVIHLTDLATGRLVAKLTDPFGDRATWMSFTPDGTQLVTASMYAKTIHVWDLRRIRARLKAMELDWAWPEFP